MNPNLQAAQTYSEELIDLGPVPLLDRMILKALILRGSTRPTFAVANYCRLEGYRIATDTVRRALQRLEVHGAVERAPPQQRPKIHAYWRRKYWRPRLIHSGTIQRGI
jgi:hypothetical protein